MHSIRQFQDRYFPEVRIGSKKRGSIADGGGSNPNVVSRQWFSFFQKSAEQPRITASSFFSGIDNRNGLVAKEFGETLFLKSSTFRRRIDSRPIFTDYLNRDKNFIKSGNGFRCVGDSIE